MSILRFPDTTAYLKGTGEKKLSFDRFANSPSIELPQGVV